LPKKLKEQQSLFTQTGGIHACALINSQGEIVALKEDVGRHNAMDKLIGDWKSYPIKDCLVLVSGRASFELVQKASKAGIPLLVSIGAPSSLAVQLAEEQGMGLIGFLKNGSFNLYTGESRVY
jgi:FdhD protein